MKKFGIDCRLICTLALLQLAPWVRADVVDDWKSGKIMPAAPEVTYSGPVQDLKFGHPAPPVSYAVPIFRNGIQRIHANTKGKLNFKEYGGGTLIGPKDGFRAVRSGVAEMATCYYFFEGQRNFALNRVWEQPFVTPENVMATNRIAQELAPKYFAPEFAKAGVVWGGAIMSTSSDIMSKKPIRKLDDMRGMKVIYQGSAMPDVAKALGITFVSIPYPDIYTAMQQGLADAVMWTDLGFIPYKIYEVAKYHTTLGLFGSGITPCYSRDWFNKLSPDLQAMFYATLEPIWMAGAKEMYLDRRQEAMEAYKKSGVEHILLPPVEMQRLRERLQPLTDKWAEEQEKAGNPARQLLADIKRLSQKYGGMSADELMNLTLKQPVLGVK